ncbi:hypothetical protein RIF29_03703 [Crotalaria pallida]|uniref:Uncharacterized protein n=1 Tax=Crotalaria pallida TaxID=3830 RepID=A0AAN9P9Z2_CROPI
MASSSSSSRSPSTSRRRFFSTMTLPSPSSTRPPSPLPRIISSPPPSPEPQRRDPNPPPRDPYRDPSSPPPPKQTHYERVAKKRREGEAKRNITIFQCLHLQQIATTLLHSNDITPLLTLIQQFTLVPKRKQYSKKKLFNSLSSCYPNSFSLKLAKLLSTHPPLHIRNEAVLLLHGTLTKPSAILRISCSMLVEINCILDGFNLLQTATSLLQSNDVAPLRTLIQEFTQLPNPNKDAKKKLFNSLSLYYPNSFSLKLAKLLYTHPRRHIRKEVVWLLQETLIETHGNDNLRISCAVLVELKSLLLESFKIELYVPLLAPLSKTIANVASRVYEFPLEGWVELLEYIFSSVVTSSIYEDDYTVFNRGKGLMLLADSSSDIFQNEEFWKHRYGHLCGTIIARMLDEMVSETFQQLTFDALLTALQITQPCLLNKYENMMALILDMMMRCIDQHPSENIVLKRLENFVDFILSDFGTVVHGKEEFEFQAILRIVDKKDVNEELRCAAVQLLQYLDETSMDNMKAIIKGLSDVDAQRIITVSMDMLLCIEDDPLWFEINKRESICAGLSRSFKLGKFLLNWLSMAADGGLVIPMAIEFLKTTYATSEDWRKRHARMIAIAGFADGQQNVMLSLVYGADFDVAKCFVEVEKLIIESLNDGHHRVLWAAMDAVQCLSEYKIIPDECHIKFFSKLFHIVRSNRCTQIQVKAVQAIHSLMKICCLDKMVPFGEKIVIVLLKLLENDKKKIQEEAMQTLKFIAALAPVMDSFISLEGQLSKRDYLVRNCMLKALDQLLRFPGVDIDRYIIKLMPMLLRSAQLDIDLKTANMTTSDRFGFSFWYLFENERVHALNVLSCGAVLSSEVFSPHIPQVCEIFNACLSCSSSKTQKASVSALPSLLRAVKLGEKDEVIQSTLHNSMVKSLVEALHKETHDTMSIRMLNTLPTCIQIAGSVFTAELIKEIADEINHILSTWSHKIIESRRAQEAGSPATSAGTSEYLPDEEMVQSVKLLTKVMAETFKGGLSPYVDGLFSTVAQLWGNDFPGRVKAVAVSNFNVIVPHFPDKLQMYHDMYTYELLRDWDRSLNVEMETARGIGICAKFGGQNFKTIVNVAMSRLNSLMVHGPSVDVDVAMISDMVVSALGTICEFHRENIDGPELGLHSKPGLQEQDIGSIRCSVIRSWLNFLPLTNDLNEARNVHAQLFKMVKRKDADVLGPNMENLPKIVFILKAILLRSNEELATEETFAELIEFLDKHDGGLS